MTDLSLTARKPSHKEWRKAAKKARRQRIRQRLAELRKAQEKLLQNSPTFLIQLEKERLLQEFEEEKEAKEREENQKKWLKEEEKAQRLWREEQRLKQLAAEERLREQERIREEWEKEQKKKQEEKERLEALKKEEERQRKETLERINYFICNGGEVPIELQTIHETNPSKEMCSFFYKVGACRFGNQCSRNHQHLKISNVLMVHNFYSHFTLDQNKSSEYDTDISLEYEDLDMYQHFRDFYLDVIPEFKKFGEVTMVKVCCNAEPHLRGNVYVEYSNQRDALVAYNGFQGRWYGGKQLNIDFVRIRDWGGAVCGDFTRKRCPKGKSCNFLHVFRNPRNEFAIDWNKNKNSVRSSSIASFDDDYDKMCRKRNWRWSESPETSPKKSKTHSRSEKQERSSSKDSLKNCKQSDRSKKNSVREKSSSSSSSRGEKRSQSKDRSKRQNAQVNIH